MYSWCDIYSRQLAIAFGSRNVYNIYIYLSIYSRQLAITLGSKEAGRK